MNNKIAIALGLVTLLAKPLFADENGWQYQPGSEDSKQITDMSQNQEYGFRFPVFEDDITPEQDNSKAELTAQELHQAGVWGLSPGEEARYVSLMQNRSGVYYTGSNLLVTPVDVLGINARTDKERIHYAELSAFQDSIKHAREFAYQKAYDDAAKALAARYNLQAVKPFDVAPFSPYKNAPINLHPGDRLMFYVRPTDNTTEITARILKLMQEQGGAQLNVYFVGSNLTQKDAVTWARANNIPPKQVASGEISLNLSFSLNPGVSTPPALYLVRDGQSQAVNLSKF